MSRMLFLYVELVAPKRKANPYLWRSPLPCPVCGKVGHIHGAGRDRETVDEYLGGRVPHCVGNADVHFVLTGARGLHGKPYVEPKKTEAHSLGITPWWQS